MKKRLIIIVLAVIICGGVLTGVLLANNGKGNESQSASVEETASESVSVSESVSASQSAGENESAPESEAGSKEESVSASEEESVSEEESESEEESITESETTSESEEESESESVHIHSYDKAVSTGKYLASAATCTKRAKYYYSCECGEAGSATFESGSLAAHTPVIDKGYAPDCTVNGLTDGSHCSVCGATIKKQEAIPATGHTYSEDWESDGFYHWHAATCKHSEEVSEKAKHDEDDFICSVCHRDTASDCGVVLEINSENNSYAVVKRSSEDIKDIIIKPAYNGIPVESIAISAFGWSDITSIVVPDSIKRVGVSAFFRCKNLQTYEYDNAYYLGNENNNFVLLLKAKNTDITSCKINEGTNVICPSAFEECAKLTEINIPGNVKSVGYYAFKKCAGITAVEFNEGLEHIDEFAFSQCDKLEIIWISASVEKIERCAFARCPVLNRINVDPYNKRYFSIANSIIDLNTKTLILGCQTTPAYGTVGTYNTEIIGDSAFNSCTELVSITLSETIKSIEDYAFWGCEKLTDIYIPDSVASIGGYAFYNCAALTGIVIPANVTEMGDSVFVGCTNLTEVEFKGTVEQWNAMKKGERMFEGTLVTKIVCSDGEVDLSAETDVPVEG